MNRDNMHPEISRQSQQQMTRKSVTRVMSFTSGKGGVGKTNTVVNTAIALAREGRSVLLMDADLGLANIDVLMGLEVRYTLSDFIEGRKQLEEILIEGPEGITIIPAASGVESICGLDTVQRLILMEAIEDLAWKYDYLLIDTPAGIGADVTFFNSAANEIVCVITGEPASLTDAYALIKVLSKNYGEDTFSVVVNNIPTEHQARHAFKRLNEAVQRFLHVKLRYLGFIPMDTAIHDAINNRSSLLVESPSSRAGLAIKKIAEEIDTDFHVLKVKGGMQFFFERILELNSYGE